jgi:cellulose biosynthesis protein BcsQ
MIIAYWSPYKGHGKVTSSMSSTATFIAINYAAKILMLDINEDNQLEKLYSTYLDSEVPSTTEGMLAVNRLVESGKAQSKNLSSTTSMILSGKLEMIRNSSVGQEEIRSTVEKTISSFSSEYDLTFVDAGSDLDSSTLNILDLADVVVICLPQYRHDFKIERLPDIVKNKSVFLLTELKDNSSITLSKIIKSTGIEKKKTLNIPFNVDFMDYCYKGNLINFILKTKVVSSKFFKKTEEELFGTSLENIKNLLFDLLEVDYNKEVVK